MYNSLPISDKVIYLVRGIKGSGKSTLASRIVDSCIMHEKEVGVFDINNFVDILTDSDFRGDKRLQARADLYQEVVFALGVVDAIVVVDSFITEGELTPYLRLAKNYGYQVEAILVQSNFKPQTRADKAKAKLQQTKLKADVSKLLNEYKVGE